MLQWVERLYNALWSLTQSPARTRRPRGPEVLHWTAGADGEWTFTGDPATCALMVAIWRRCRALAARMDGRGDPGARPAAWDEIGPAVGAALPESPPGRRTGAHARVVRAVWRLIELEGRGLVTSDERR